METNATLEMKDDLRQFPLAFNALLMREVQAQNAIRQKCLEDIARAQKTIKDTTTTETELRSSLQQRDAQINAQTQRIHTEQKKLCDLEMKYKTMQDDTTARQDQSEAIQQYYIKLVSEVEELRKQRSCTVDELKKAVTFYKQRLGLEFDTPDIKSGGLRLKFKYINSVNANKCCVFTVRVNANNVYEISNCSPVVKRLPALVKILNATNDFFGFVLEMRRAFKSNVA